MRLNLLWAMRMLVPSRFTRGTKLSKIQVEGPSEYQNPTLGASPTGAGAPEFEFLAAVPSAILAGQSWAFSGDRK
jgi:hypothetical protein